MHAVGAVAGAMRISDRSDRVHDLARRPRHPGRSGRTESLDSSTGQIASMISVGIVLCKIMLAV
jgi:hypothetical protein